MKSIIADDQGPVEYDYDEALRIVRAVQRAVKNPEFLAGVEYAYLELGQVNRAARFILAVKEQREFAAIEAEFGTEDVTA